MARGTHSMLRLALLCHLSVAGAVRLATNVACLQVVAEEVFLNLTGARATAFPKSFPQADALSGVCGADSEMLHNNLGGQGGKGKNELSKLNDKGNYPNCQGKQKNDACSTAMGALAPSTQSPEGSACLTVHLVARAQSSETS